VHLFVISSYSLKVSAKSVCAAWPVGILSLADVRYQAGFACQGLLLVQATLRMRDSSMLNNVQRRTVYPYCCLPALFVSIVCQHCLPAFTVQAHDF